MRQLRLSASLMVSQLLASIEVALLRQAAIGLEVVAAELEVVSILPSRLSR